MRGTRGGGGGTWENGSGAHRVGWGENGVPSGFPATTHSPSPLATLTLEYLVPLFLSVAFSHSTCSLYHNPIPVLPALRPQSNSPGCQSTAQTGMEHVAKLLPSCPLPSGLVLYPYYLFGYPLPDPARCPSLHLPH